MKKTEIEQERRTKLTQPSATIQSRTKHGGPEYSSKQKVESSTQPTYQIQQFTTPVQSSTPYGSGAQSPTVQQSRHQRQQFPSIPTTYDNDNQATSGRGYSIQQYPTSSTQIPNSAPVQTGPGFSIQQFISRQVEETPPDYTVEVVNKPGQPVVSQPDILPEKITIFNSSRPSEPEIETSSDPIFQKCVIRQKSATSGYEGVTHNTISQHSGHDSYTTEDMREDMKLVNKSVIIFLCSYVKGSADSGVHQ